MKEELFRQFEKRGVNIPSIVKKYVRYAIWGIASLFITGIVLTALLVYVLIRFLGGPVSERATDITNQGSELVQEGRQSLEERLTSDEKKIEELEKRINELENNQ